MVQCRVQKTLRLRGWYRKPLNMGVEHMEAPKIQICNYLLKIVSFILVVINMFMYQRYLEFDEPHGFTRSNFILNKDVRKSMEKGVGAVKQCFGPQNESSGCPKMFCNETYLEEYLLGGCSDEDKELNDGECKTATKCDFYIEEQLNVFDVTTGVAFIPTRVKEKVYERDCDISDADDYCRLTEWKQISSTSRFVAGADEAQVRLEHSFIAARFREEEPGRRDWVQSSFDMPGSLVRLTAEGDRVHMKEFGHSGDLDPGASRWNIKNNKTDGLTIKDVCDSVGINSLDDKSDAPDAAGATFRYDGMVIIASIFYNNMYTAFPPAYPAKYEYTMTRLPGLEFKAYRTEWLEYPRRLLIEHRSGIYIHLIQTGQIAKFSPLALLTYMAAMFPLIRLSRFLCDMVAAFVLIKNRKGYQKFPPGERRARAEQDFLKVGVTHVGSDKDDPFSPVPSPDEVVCDDSLFSHIRTLQEKVAALERQGTPQHIDTQPVLYSVPSPPPPESPANRFRATSPHTTDGLLGSSGFPRSSGSECKKKSSPGWHNNNIMEGLLVNDDTTSLPSSRGFGGQRGSSKELRRVRSSKQPYKLARAAPGTAGQEERRPHTSAVVRRTNSGNDDWQALSDPFLEHHTTEYTASPAPSPSPGPSRSTSPGSSRSPSPGPARRRWGYAAWV